MKSLRPPTPFYIFGLLSALSTADSNECRIVIAQNEWAAGCKPIVLSFFIIDFSPYLYRVFFFFLSLGIPAVNFVVKLVDCGEGVAM